MKKTSSQLRPQVDRKGTDSVKWDGLQEIFGNPDALPFWVADMDFQAPSAVLQALKERVEHGVFGYSLRPDSYDEAILSWMSRRHGLELEKEALLYVPGVMTGIAKAVQAFSEPGDRIVIQPPVYFPFFDLVKNNGRELGEAPLAKGEGRFSIDFDALEEELARSNTRILLFCSPHNPVGRVWTREELQKVAELCERYDVLILSDEIHQDIVYNGHQQIPFLTLDPELQKRCIAFSSPSKTFNLQGLISAFAMIPDKKLRERFHRALKADHIVLENALSIVACGTAYAEGEEWLEELLACLDDNRQRVIDAFGAGSGIQVFPPEGTYLALLDCKGLGRSDAGLKDLFLNKASVALNAGKGFGRGGEGMMRLNFASPRDMLDEGLDRIKRVV